MKKILFYYYIAFTVLLAGAVIQANAQGTVGINTTGASPDNSAGLDLSFNNKGLLAPRMTLAQRNAIILPAQGLLIYNTDCGVFNFNAGTASSPNWQSILAGGVPPAGLTITGSISGATNVCQNSTGNIYSVTSVSGATSYNWSLPSGATITAGSGTNSITVTFGTTSGNISVAALNSCTTSAPVSMAITVNTLAPVTPGTITGPTSTCPSSGGNVYSIANIAADVSYTWSVPAGASIASGQGTNSVTVTFGSTVGNVSVTGSNSCGTSSANSITVTGLPGICGTGGTITSLGGGHYIHVFNSSGTFTAGASGNIQILVVGGGGGGGQGGGGAGGLYYNASLSITPGTYTVTVGTGGAAMPNIGAMGNAGSGTNSSFAGGSVNIVALGGGGGANTSGLSGGSGGAGGGNASIQNDSGGAATQPSSTSGGFGYPGTSDNYSCCGTFLTGAGGGAGGVGVPGDTGHGGPGLSYSISGSSVTYAAGGEGTGFSDSHHGSTGIDNTGNGGGGGSTGSGGTGGNGGLGVLVIQY